MLTSALLIVSLALGASSQLTDGTQESGWYKLDDQFVADIAPTADTDSSAEFHGFMLMPEDVRTLDGDGDWESVESSDFGAVDGTSSKATLVPVTTRTSVTHTAVYYYPIDTRPVLLVVSVVVLLVIFLVAFLLMRRGNERP